jgi:hypothetical protein
MKPEDVYRHIPGAKVFKAETTYPIVVLPNAEAFKDCDTFSVFHKGLKGFIRPFFSEEAARAEWSKMTPVPPPPKAYRVGSLTGLLYGVVYSSGLTSEDVAADIWTWVRLSGLDYSELSVSVEGQPTYTIRRTK